MMTRGGLMFVSLCLIIAVISGAYTDDLKHTEYNDLPEPKQKDLTIWLGHRNFTQFVEDTPLMLVAFVDHSCRHCQELMVQLIWAAHQVAYKWDPLPVAKINAPLNPTLAEEFGIEAVPALFIIEEGVSRPWLGETDAITLSNMMKSAQQLMVNELTLAKETKSFLKANDVVLVGAFDAFEGDDYMAFKMAVRGGEAAFAAVLNSNAEVMEHLNMAPNTYELFVHRHSVTESYPVKAKKGVDQPVVEPLPTAPARVLYDGPKNNADAIEAFCLHEATPYVLDVNVDNVKSVFRSPFNVHVMLFADPKSADFHAHLREFHSVARQYNRAVSFDPKFAVLSVRDSFVQSNMMPYYGVHREHAPLLLTAAIDFSEGTKKYKLALEAGMGADDMSEFVRRSTGTNGGTVNWPRFYRSQPVPDPEFGEDYEEYVKMLVADSFKEEVLDGERDVLVFFFAPWCAHSQRLLPVWHRFAETTYNNSPNLVVARIDGTLNEIPELEIPAYPMIVMFPASAKSLKDGVEFSEAGYENPDHYNLALFSKETAEHRVKMRVADEDSLLEYVKSALAEAEDDSDVVASKDEL